MLNLINEFQKNVKNNPDKIALIYSGIKMTYKELDSKSNCLANVLQNTGLKKMVPLYL